MIIALYAANIAAMLMTNIEEGRVTDIHDAKKKGFKWVALQDLNSRRHQDKELPLEQALILIKRSLQQLLKPVALSDSGVDKTSSIADNKDMSSPDKVAFCTNIF